MKTVSIYKRTLRVTTLAISCMAFAGTIKADSLTASTTVASDYIADGISASDSRPALQLGLEYEQESGFYVGAWSSNIDSDDPATPNLELDYTIGLQRNFNAAFAWDIGVTHYTYHDVPDDDAWNYQEWYAGMTVLENTTFYYHYADDDKVWNGIQRRYILEHTQPLPGDFSLLLTAEHIDVETAIGDDYDAYRIGASKNWFDMDFTVSYWDNTVDHGDNNTKDRFVLEIAKSFDLLPSH